MREKTECTIIATLAIASFIAWVFAGIALVQTKTTLEDLKETVLENKKQDETQLMEDYYEKRLEYLSERVSRLEFEWGMITEDEDEDEDEDEQYPFESEYDEESESVRIHEHDFESEEQ